MAADHDDLTVGNEYLDVYDGSKSRTYDDGIRHYLCNDRWIVIFYNRSLILADLIQFSTQYKGIQNTLLKELTVPYAIILEDGHILWKNDRFFGNRGWKRKVYPEDNPGIEQGNFSEG